MGDPSADASTMAGPLGRWRHLRLVELAGEGTFGRLYRAWDERLDREVALKLLKQPGAGVGDAAIEEGRLLAKVRHPNVVTVYGADRDDDGSVGIWMEFVRGRTLAELLRDRGPFNADEASAIGRDVCGALAAVHRAGLLHRDVKAQNVMREHGGRIVLMDFGAGKEHAYAAGHSLAGTPVYLPPEVLGGAPPSPASDVYNVGVMLFHLVTGQYPVTGRTLDDVREAHATGRRQLLRDVRPDLPEAFVAVVERAIAADPRVRFQTAGELERALRSAAGATPDRRLRQRALTATAAAAVVTLAAVAGAAWIALRPAPPIEQVQFTIEPPDRTQFADCCEIMSVSPDGRSIAFEAGHKLWVRALDASARALAGTDGGARPFWSPDSRSIAFLQDGRLKTVDVNDGKLRVVVEEARNIGAWGSAGVIVFVGLDHRLLSVPAGGGQPAGITELDAKRRETMHLWPSFLPDGRRFLFVAGSEAEGSSIELASVADPGRTRLLTLQSTVVYSSGHLFYQRDGTLTAQPFDAAAGRLIGQPHTLINGIDYNPSDGSATFSVAANGTLAYRLATPPLQALTWFDRSGNRLEVSGEPGPYQQLALSPDGRSIALNRVTKGNQEIVALALGTNILSAVASAPAYDAVWMPGGRGLAFESPNGGQLDLFSVGLDGLNRSAILKSNERKFFDDWSSDGRFIVYHVDSPTGVAAYMKSMESDGPPKELIRAWPGDVDQLTISPDGRSIAYESNADGDAWNVYVADFPSMATRRKISPQGGFEPHWRADGRELFYRSLDRRLMSIDVVPGPPMIFGTAKALFQVPRDAQWTGGLNNFAVTRDGKKFLLLIDTKTALPAPITVITHWAAGLR